MITLLGDIAFTGILSTQPEENRERFKEVVPILSQGGVVFANLEVPILAGDEVNEHKKLLHYSLQKPTEELLQMLNIGCVSLANNHVYDYKMPGLVATIETLDRLGIHHTGAGWRREHLETVIINKGGKTIGFMAYVDPSTNPKTEMFPELLINCFEEEKVLKDIENLKSRVDIIICSIHWGVDYSFYPTPWQREVAHKLVDAGVNIIMGHHPHTLQPYEEYNGGHVFYSLGGLTFGDFIKLGKDYLQALPRKTKKGVIVQRDSYNGASKFISTKERKGNFIKLTKRNYSKRSKIKWFGYRIKHVSSITHWLFNFKESFVDGVLHYFFAYYQNPFKRLVQISNSY